MEQRNFNSLINNSLINAICFYVFFFIISSCNGQSHQVKEEITKSPVLEMFSKEYDMYIDKINIGKDSLKITFNHNVDEDKINIFLEIIDNRTRTFFSILIFELISIDEKIDINHSVFPEIVKMDFFYQGDHFYSYSYSYDKYYQKYKNDFRETLKEFEQKLLFNVSFDSYEFYNELFMNILRAHSEVLNFYVNLEGLSKENLNFDIVAVNFFFEECLNQNLSNEVNSEVFKHILKEYLRNEDECEECSLTDIADLMVFCDRPDLMNQALDVRRQQHGIDEPPEVKKMKNDDCGETDEIFTVVEQSPAFPGGTEKMVSFINKNLKYPEEALKDSIEGRVIVNFIVETDGSLSEIEVGNNPTNSDVLAEEAKRLLEEMPDWKPGLQNDCPKRVRVNLPIPFQINE